MTGSLAALNYLRFQVARLQLEGHVQKSAEVHSLTAEYDGVALLCCEAQHTSTYKFY
jgi:hypothetical protein